MKNWQKNLWLPGSLLIALVLAPILTKGNTQDDQLIQQHQQQIARMSAAERSRLDRNFKSFQALSTAEKKNYQALNQAIHSSSNQDQLSAILEDYSAWLRRIEPYHRSRLSQEKDPARKVALIREILESQRLQTANREFRSRFGAAFVRRDGENIPSDRRGPLGLNDEDLTKVMSAIEQEAISNQRLNATQMSDLSSRQGMERFVSLLRMLREVGPNGQQPLTIAPPPEFATVAQRIDQTIDDKDVREFLSSDWKPPARRPNRGDSSAQLAGEGQDPLIQPANRLALVLFRSLSVKLMRERPTVQNQPSRETLLSFFQSETLPAARKEELLQFEAADFVTDLRHEYLNPVTLRDLFFPERRRGAQGGFGPERGGFRPSRRPGDFEGPPPGDFPPFPAPAPAPVTESAESEK